MTVTNVLLGDWRIWTFGLFGMFKSDWTTIGGFDTKKFTTKWGGEDNNLLDRYGYLIESSLHPLTCLFYYILTFIHTFHLSVHCYSLIYPSLLAGVYPRVMKSFDVNHLDYFIIIIAMLVCGVPKVIAIFADYFY